MRADTLASLRDEVLLWLDESGNTGTTADIVENALNQAHLQRCTQMDWPFMKWPRWESFATVAGQKFYSLHPACYALEEIKARETGQPLVEVPSTSWGELGTKEGQRETPSCFRLHGTSPIQNQPATAGTISIISTAGGDTGSTYAVTIDGWTAAGLPVSETINPTGTSTATGSVTFHTIGNITQGGAWTGTMTVTCGATTITVVGAGEYARFYPVIELQAEADGAKTFDYSFYRMPRVLARENDVPDIPPPFSKILVWDTLISFGGYNTDIGQKNLAIWASHQKTLERQMEIHYMTSRTMHALPRYIGMPGAGADAGVRVYRG